ncbi:hypothetical protein CLAIMM_02283 [Cladophialophora immunda]|nr:hypothetical protein CLAIMM_02283 [Cladophialophora immunda]
MTESQPQTRLSSPPGPSMGILTLPPEIRSQVYVECVKISALGLLYANKQFHNEFIPFLREKFVLGFHIDPAASSTVVTLINSDDSPWGINACTIDATSAHPNYDILDRMPVDRFRGIRILVDAPNPKDPGQLVRGWLQANRLMTVLLPRSFDPGWLPRDETEYYVPAARSTRSLPPVTIHVRERGSRRWHDGKGWHVSVPDFSEWDPATNTAAIRRQRANSDLLVLLTPFARIRHADAVTVNLPRNAPSHRAVDVFTAFLAFHGTQPRSFGLDIRHGAIWDDDDTLALEDALHVWLDYLLDDMEGPTAALLRRDRFKFWCSEYEYQMGHRFYGSIRDGRYAGDARTFLEDDLFNQIARTWHDRFMSAREHVVAGYRDALRRQGRSVYLSTHKEEAVWRYARELQQLGLVGGGKNRHLDDDDNADDTFWETCYPHGIARKSRNESWDDTVHLVPPLLYRLEPPERSDVPACKTFPSFVGAWCACESDWFYTLFIMHLQQPLRDYLFTFNPRPGAPRLLGPIE